MKRDTNGKVLITVHPNSTLGADATELTAVVRGAQFGFVSSAGDLESYSPLFEAIDLPYVFPGGGSQAQAVLNGPAGHKLDASLRAKGLVNVGWLNWGARDILSKTPIISPASLKGVKMRSQPAPSFEAAYKAYHANIDPIAWDQVYTALSTGTVDALEAEPTALYSQKLYQVAHYLTLTDATQEEGNLIVSKKVLEELPTKEQQIVLKDGKAAAKAEWPAEVKANAADVTKMKNAGTKVIKPDKQAWKAALGNTDEIFVHAQGSSVASFADSIAAAAKTAD